MLQQLFLFLLITATPLSLAMEQAPHENKHAAKMGYFSLLTEDILDLIAQYLPFDDIESKEEFIERTKTTIKKELPLNPPQIINKNTNFFGINYFMTAFCPNEKKCALLETLSLTLTDQPNVATSFNGYNNYELKTVNIRKNKTIHTESFSIPGNMYYKQIALSPCANIFAIMSEREEFGTNTISHKTTKKNDAIHAITIKNIITNKLQYHELPLNFHFYEPDDKEKTPLLIAFNKQGTDLIIRGIDFSNPKSSQSNTDKNPLPHHIIIPININENNSSPTKKTLQHYFSQKAICKAIVKSTPEF